MGVPVPGAAHAMGVLYCGDNIVHGSTIRDRRSIGQFVGAHGIAVPNNAQEHRVWEYQSTDRSIRYSSISERIGA
eukprot:2460776-Rhodomonas_salina.2